MPETSPVGDLRTADPRSGRRLTPPRLFRGFNVKGFTFALLVTAALELLVRSELMPAYLPAPSVVADELVREMLSGSMSSQLGITMQVFAGGLAAAAAIGITVGLCQSLWRPVDDAIKLVVEAGRPIPAVALIPMAILILGLGTPMRMSVVIYGSVWPILMNTYYAVRSVDPLAVDTARTFGMSNKGIIIRVVLPSALPGIIAGFRISAAIALVLAVTTELIAGTSGIGFYMAQVGEGGRVAALYAAIVLTGIIGYLINTVLNACERRFVYWSPGVRSEERP